MGFCEELGWAQPRWFGYAWNGVLLISPIVPRLSVTIDASSSLAHKSLISGLVILVAADPMTG